MARPPLPVVGWREWIQLPDWDLVIKAKVDTGARTSAIHAENVTDVDVDGVPHVSFDVLPHQHLDDLVRVRAVLVDRRTVRSSTGHEELRRVVRTPIRVGGKDAPPFPIELTLTSRDSMGFRMLLGRAAVRRRYLVDPGRSFVQAPRRRR